MDTNTNYTFEELFETAETAVVNFVGLAENLPELYKQIMTCTTGFQVATNDAGSIKSIKLEHRDVGENQHIVIDCGKHGHAIKIFSNNVEVFSNELDKKLVRALHYLARLETLFKWEYNIPVNEDVQ